MSLLGQKQKKITFEISPTPNGRELTNLVEQFQEANISVKIGLNPNEIKVNPKDSERVTAVLRVLGYHTVDKWLHEASLKGALNKLANKYQINEQVKFGPSENITPIEKPTERPSSGFRRNNLMSFVQRKVRGARTARVKRRAQYIRDKLDGKIEAYEEILRYLRGRK